MYKSDLEIAQATKMNSIIDVAKSIGLLEDDIELYGKYKAKINPSFFEKVKDQPDGKVILVTAITPTPAGEGKSTTTVGLGQAFKKIGKNSIIALREPSFGPVMGVKGGAAGGGYAQVVPMEDLNLHFTGDIHAITTANNAISAIIDNHIHQGNILNIDPRRISWKRCLDMNDRALRNIIIGLGGVGNSLPREDGFNITVASEIMAVLCLSKDLADLKSKIKKIVIAETYKREIITVGDLGCEGAITLILRDAIKPNLVQTLENTPAIIHGGPFANIAHGCNSIIATNIGRKLADYVITEAGFGADLGAEKFMNIKTRAADFKPSCVVIVATVRALKMHGGVLKNNLKEENVNALLKGVENLQKHIESIKEFNVPYVVAINKFVNDTKMEIEALANWCITNNHPIEYSDVWALGGDGAIKLANTIVNLCDSYDTSNFKYLYELEDTIENKIDSIVTKIYGADGVDFTSKAKAQIKTYVKRGWDKLPICMAKTQSSLTDDPKIIGRPKGFRITIREFRPSIGAGFLVALTGDVLTMPGLPKKPAAYNMDVDDNGNAKGLF